MENYIVIYAIVPKEIYETKMLTPEEKLIAERIIYLCKKEGYCWITNKRLSEMYSITIETASRHIKKLEKIGLIKCIYDHNDKNTKRVIQLVDDIWTKWSTRDKSNNQDDIDCSIKHNNKYNKRREYKYNSDKYDKTPVPWWLDEEIEQDLATPEEQAEMQRMIDEITGGSDE
ncbi:MAG: helix-turn-helix domain-containing protein, partial [Bacilli bacterium]|nr:helix-turn-helix domain-containing protein [Bacilli bacterium]